MKNLILLFCAMMIAGIGYAQVKVVANGRVKMGETANAPLSDLHISNSGQGVGFAVERTDAGNFVKAAAGTVAGAFFYQENGIFFVTPAPDINFVGNGASATKGLSVVGTTGDVGIGTWTPAADLDVIGSIAHNGTVIHSDLRLKNDVKKYDVGLDAIMSMNPVSYTYTGKGGTKAGVQHIGIIAQDLQKVAPEFVEEYTHKDAEFPNGLDGEMIIKSQKNYLRIKDNEIKYLLWNAIQDQQEIIDDQDKTINELENKVADLENKMNEVLNIIKNSEVLDLVGGKASLGQNRPNPFNQTTMIDYFIPEKSSNAQIEVFSMNGQLLDTKVIDHKGLGNLTINAKDLASGAYSYRLVVDGEVVGTNKMILQN